MKIPFDPDGARERLFILASDQAGKIESADELAALCETLEATVNPLDARGVSVADPAQLMIGTILTALRVLRSDRFPERWHNPDAHLFAKPDDPDWN